MSGSLNKVEIIGHLGKDPDIKTMQSGDKVANFSVATSERWKDNGGEVQEKTQWHNIVVWNKHLVPIVEKYMKKGDRVYLCGQIETRKWQGQDGVEKYTTEIVLRFEGKIILLTPQTDQRHEQRQEQQRPAQRQQSAPASYDALEDEIPF